MPVAVSVDEYLHTDYEPDCDYVDGELIERNVGEKKHGKTQKKLLIDFEQRSDELGIFVLQEQRVQISERRYRVPDLLIADYLAFGVRYVWMIDPQARRAWIYSTGQMHEVTDGFLRTESPEIVVPFDRIFE